MPFYQFDERPKNREEEEALLQAFLADGGKITVVPNGKKMKQLRRSRTAFKRKAENDGLEVLFTLNKF